MKINNREFLYGLGQISAIVVFMAALIGYWIFQDYLAEWSFINSKYKWLVGFSILFVGAQMIASIIDILQGRHKATLNNFLIMWLSYLILTFVNLLLLVFSIPLIILSFILGPVMLFGGFLSAITLFIYIVQDVFNYPLVANPPSSKYALISSVILIGCFLVFRLYFKSTSEANNFMDRYIDIYVNKIMEPTHKWNERLLTRLDE